MAGVDLDSGLRVYIIFWCDKSNMHPPRTAPLPLGGVTFLLCWWPSVCAGDEKVDDVVKHTSNGSCVTTCKMTPPLWTGPLHSLKMCSPQHVEQDNSFFKKSQYWYFTSWFTSSIISSVYLPFTSPRSFPSSPGLWMDSYQPLQLKGYRCQFNYTHYTFTVWNTQIPHCKTRCLFSFCHSLLPG